MDLSEIKARYRELAKRYHPDLHPGDNTATEQMTRANEAYRTLTGAEAEDLLEESARSRVSYRDDASYHKSSVEVEAFGIKREFTISMGVYIDEASARDWIQDVAFSCDGKRVYATTGTGRVFEFSADGAASRVFLVGGWASTIQDAGGRLHLATDTRLYVIEGSRLIAVDDIFEAGRPVVAQTGVLLWDAKRISWIDRDGRRVGRVSARHPVRHVNCERTRWIVQTRQHSVAIGGTPSWWA